MPTPPVSSRLATPGDLRRDRSILALAAALCGALGAAGLAALAVSAQLSDDHHDRALADATSSLNAATELLEQTRGELQEERKALHAARAKVRSTPAHERRAKHRRKHRRGEGHTDRRQHRGHQAPEVAPPTPSAARAPSPIGDPASRELTTLSDLSRIPRTAIHCESEERCRIDGQAIEAAAKSQPEDEPPSARFVPSIRDGERRGTKVYGIRSGSAMKLLGFRNGDNITSVQLKGPTQDGSGSETPALLTLSIELERKGKPLRKTLDVI